MIFNRTTTYALRVLSCMATDEKKLLSTKEIHESVSIPFRYLRKQMTMLAKSGLIESIQGKHGGYRIAKDLNKIALLDIIRITGDLPFDNLCFFGYEKCDLKKKCAIHDKWSSIRHEIHKVLASTTLAEIKEKGA